MHISRPDKGLLILYFVVPNFTKPCCYRLCRFIRRIRENAHFMRVCGVYLWNNLPPFDSYTGNKKQYLNLSCLEVQNAEKTHKFLQSGKSEVVEGSIMEIRYIRPEDDRMAISKIYEDSWKYAYKGIIPQDYLDAIPKGRWVSNLDNPDIKTLICIDHGRIVGTSSFCKSRFEQFGDWGEVISIDLLPDYMGKGYGKLLLEAVIKELMKLGYRDVFLWVLEDNIRAKHFYERFGFSLAYDNLNDNIGGKDLKEIRYVYKNDKPEFIGLHLSNQ